MGLEPTTTGITIRYSNQLSYAHRNHKSGAPDRNRTCNRRLRRPMLYPVELQALDLSRTPAGRGRGIRTHDIQLPKLALYQAELYPDFETRSLSRTEALKCYGGHSTPSIRIEHAGFQTLSGSASDVMPTLQRNLMKHCVC